ncbi:hypothetical protein EMMF5_006103 [Cystobasidiomycetes sp. EMM_F5]
MSATQLATPSTLAAAVSQYGLTPSDFTDLSPQAIQQLLIDATSCPSVTTVTFFSVPIYSYFGLLLILAGTSQWLVKRFVPTFSELSRTNQKTSVMYIVNIIVTTIALVLQLLACPMLAQGYTEERFGYARLAASLVVGLYLFEAIYRQMRWQMLMHHVCTIIAIFLVIISIPQTHHPSVIAIGLAWLFQATAEQTVFLGLLLYRFRASARLVRNILRASAIQTLIVKFGFGIYVLAIWAAKDSHNTKYSLDIGFSVILVLMVVLLIAVQFWGAWVTWKIGSEVASRYEKQLASTAISTTSNDVCSNSTSFTIIDEDVEACYTPDSLASDKTFADTFAAAELSRHSVPPA